MHAETLKRKLCNMFCGAIDVRPVPSGYAISSAFEDQSGDQISFYLTETDDGFQAEDDGSYLSHLIAKEIQIDQGMRGHLLDSILHQADAYWDRSTYEIKSKPFSENEISRRLVDFISSLIRVRDLEFMTREVVRSTFKEDAAQAIRNRFSDVANLNEDEAVDPDFAEFPADMIIKPTAQLHPRSGAVYFVNSPDKLNEALLLHMDLQLHHKDNVEVFALLEDMRIVNPKKFQRAQNRALSMPIFKGDEDSAIGFIARKLGVS